MDIDEYLQEKRALEAKKELLEAKERLKDDAEKRKRELEREKRKVGGEKAVSSSPAPEDRRGEPVSSEYGTQDMFRKIMVWNILAVLIIVVLFATLWFFPKYGQEQIEEILGKGSDTVTGSTVIEKDKESTQTTPPKDSISLNPNVTNGTAPATYPGPEFLLFAEDSELGEFDENGKLGGENLVISASHYEDLVLHLENQESGVTKCFIDREVTVDENLDGKDDLRDYDLDIFVYELDPYEKFTWTDSLPGSFDQGSYDGAGKITALYEARCYYCVDASCEDYDENGESDDSIKVKVEAKPGS